MILNSGNKENIKKNGISLVIVKDSEDSDDSESVGNENFLLWRDYYGDEEQGIYTYTLLNYFQVLIFFSS